MHVSEKPDPADFSEVELAWLAGLLEGEGCFSLVNSGTYPTIVLAMTDKDVVQHVARMFGNHAHYQRRPPGAKPHHKESWRTAVYGVRAIQWMKVLYPWLGERRRARIDEIIQEQRAREGLTSVRRYLDKPL